MRTLSQEEVDLVGGGADFLKIGGVTITGMEAGLALRNAMGAMGVAYGFGYGGGLLFNAGWQAVSGDSFGTDLYQAKQWMNAWSGAT